MKSRRRLSCEALNRRRSPVRWINLAEVQSQYKRMAPRVKHMNTVQLYCTAKSTACYGTC